MWPSGNWFRKKSGDFGGMRFEPTRLVLQTVG